MSDSDLLPIERYAEALAYQREYPESQHAAILGKLGIGPGALSRAADLWPKQMLAALSSGDPSDVLAFARAYAQVEGRVRLLRPAVDAIRPSDGLGAVPQRAAVRSKGIRPLAPAPKVEPLHPAPTTSVPTYLQPHRQADAAATPVETFTALSAAAGHLANVDVDETGALDWKKLGSSVLPFQRDAAGATAPATAPRAPEPTLPRSPHMAPTEELSADALDRAVVPFPAVARELAAEADDTEETIQVPPPAPATTDAPPSPMTLERYATLSAELASGEQAEVLARFGLKRETWVAAMSEMAARFKNEPGLEEKYRGLMREQLAIARTR